MAKSKPQTMVKRAGRALFRALFWLIALLLAEIIAPILREILAAYAGDFSAITGAVISHMVAL